MTNERNTSRLWPWILCGGLFALLSLVGCQLRQANCADHAGHAETPERKLVRVVVQHEGDVTRFLVENRELTDITMSFNFELKNLKSSHALPFTATFPAQQTTEAFTLTPVNPDEPWDYSFTNFHNLGNTAAVHDDSYRYHLPYAPGEKFRVTQGYDGSYTHQNGNRFSIDWAMPEGTPVYAARGGKVLRAKDDSDRGGRGMKFDRFNNYIVIQHSDGTLGNYSHLLQGGVKVQPGDIVSEGQLIALSGNTGYSSGPHLHFSVYRPKNGRERESIPVKFATSQAAAVVLKSGNRYQAVPPSSLPMRDVAGVTGN